MFPTPVVIQNLESQGTMRPRALYNVVCQHVGWLDRLVDPQRLSRPDLNDRTVNCILRGTCKLPL